jgi:hypothetical protein
MALETPNAIVASMLMYVDFSLPTPNAVTNRSSVGIASKVSETPGFGGILATWELEHPLSNDEAIVSGTNAMPGGVGGGLVTMLFAFIAPLAQATGDLALDTIPQNLLATQMVSSFGLPKGRVSVNVFGLQTTATPIAGEPLP